jgi:predicted RNA-binding Zn-ribbon protein involved in translation (DUF1610 family)
MEQIPDHPVIRRMERTGYPTQPKVVHQCSECGQPIYDGDSCYAFSWGWICEDCADRAYQIAEV